MKRTFYPLKLCVAAVFACITMNLQAQTMTGTILTQPCNNNGQIGVTVTGLTPPINYVYNNYLNNQTIVHSNINSLSNSVSGLPAYQNLGWWNANIWNVSASDGLNTVFATFTLTPPFSDSIKVTPGICPAPSTLEAIGFVGGTAPFSCAWTNTLTSQTYTSNPALVSNGTYTFVITDAAGCKVISPLDSLYAGVYVASQSNIALSITGAPANCTNGTATVTASGGTAPYGYLWSNGATSQNLSGLSMGSYNCTVTDAIGCQASGFYSVPQSISINFNTSNTNATCLQNNGSILGFVSGGTAPYTYLWSNGATTQNISGLAGPASYNVQITDANGCLGIGFTYITSTTPISVTYMASPSSCTASTGAATLTATGGVAPYSVVWNTFPSPSSGTSISGRPAGSYLFTVTDANGCIRTGAAVIPPVSTINAGVITVPPTCPATTGNMSLSVTGTNGPFTYAWNNSSTNSSISNVPLGYYSCVITDALGCTLTKNASISQLSPVSAAISSTPASCILTNDGAIQAIPGGGTAPYTYLWSNTQAAATATGLATGYYHVKITDVNGCYQNMAYNYVGYNAANNSCYCTITGTVYADANTNCVRNSGENGISNIQIHCTGLGYAYTNSNGVYSFLAPTGTYTLTETILPMYPLASCQTNNQPVSVTAGTNCITSVDFANTVTPIHDLHIITSNVNWPVPGNTYNQKVIVQNDGSVTESSIKLGYTHDGQLTYGSCAPWTLTQQNAGSYPDWYSITSGFTTLTPASSSAAYINYNVPTNIPMGTLVNFHDSVANAAPISTSWLTDNTPWNNVNNHQVLVVSSYDPNFKEVSPKGVGPQGNISYSDTSLTYVIHFQNTGSYFAQNVVVVDSLDTDLMVSSLRPGYSDHAYSTTVSDNGVIKFNFKNINLPWQSGYGDALSSGMVSYTIKMKKNLLLGTQFKNKAAIYFDYNDPIITNTTINTLAGLTTSVKEIKGVNADRFNIFPNPASDQFTLNFVSTESAAGILSVIDLSGRNVSSSDIVIQTGENNLNAGTSHLQNGIYLVQLKTSKETITKKLVVSK